MRTQTVTLTGTGPTSALTIDLGRFRNGVGLLCTVDVGATAAYSVEVSGDNIHWNLHDVIFNRTASANDSIAYPVNFVRLNGVTVNGSVTLVIIQAS